MGVLGGRQPTWVEDDWDLLPINENESGPKLASDIWMTGRERSRPCSLGGSGVIPAARQPDSKTAPEFLVILELERKT